MNEGLKTADRMLDERGVQRDCGAYVTSLAFTRDQTHAVFGLGDGRLIFRARTGTDWHEYPSHDGAVTTLAPDFDGVGILSGGDDGTLQRFEPHQGAAQNLARYGMKWIDHVLSVADRKAPLRAVAVGKNLHLLDQTGQTVRTLAHPSTITGLALDAKAKRIGASHYNGASLWFLRSDQSKPLSLEWKGSHLAIAIHPSLYAVATAMQENALHGWRISDLQHMRMSGYPAKPESLGFTASGKWLASAGAEAIILWPFFGGGPMGKAPLELAGGDQAMVKRIACHPAHEVVAAGYSDGLVLVVDIERQRVLPVAAPGRGAISALGWSDDGALLGVGTETGFVALIDFSIKETAS